MKQKDHINNDCTILVGGEAGYGILSIGNMISYAMSRGGLYVFANDEIPSLIRGGHNTYQIRVKDTKIYCHRDTIDLLIALNKDTIDEHISLVSKNGIIIYDEEEVKGIKVDTRYISVPIKKIALEVGKNLVMRNTVAFGAMLACIQYDTDIIKSVITDTFKRKGQDVVDTNIAVALAGYDYVIKNYKDVSPYMVKPISDKRQLMVDGNEAMSFGAIRAGVNFIAAYPMTPATTVWQNIVRSADKYNIIIKQAEDEIASINMIIGAAYAGARAMTATSGGGYSLMVEALGMAGQTETPIVVVESQRPGPSTGLPTRTEQGDLRFVMHSSQGDFPRVVMAPGDPEQAFYMMGEAFNLADRYQIPVLVLSDKYLSSSKVTVPDFDQSKITIDRGDLIPINKKVKDYKRFALTENGVSPRALPGSPQTFWVSTDEHIEVGHLREDPETRKAMVDKRMRKLRYIEKEIEGYKLFGNPKAKTVFVVWGSTLGPAREACELLQKEKKDICIFQITHVIPFKTKEIKKILTGKDIILIEGNPTGQLGQVIQEHTGIMIDKRILKYDGRPFSPDYIIKQYHELR